MNWQQEIDLSDIFHNDTLSFEARRDNIAKRIRLSQWFKSKDDFDDLPPIVEELEETPDSDAFDEVWNAVYDEADADKVWIRTR